MMCEHCKNEGKQLAMGFTTCELCGDVFVSAYSPPEKICEACSSRYGACQICGMSAYKQLSLFDD